MKSIIILSALTLFAGNALAGIQTQIDALPSTGGEIKLGCGIFNEPAIALRDDVALVGSGACTVVPTITVANNTTRRYRVRIENLMVDGSIDGTQYIGIDLRNVSLGRVRNVQIKNVQTGVLLYQTAYYNTLEDLIIDATTDCYEILDGANENILRGGRCGNGGTTRLGIGMWVRNAGDVKVFGTSFENLNVGVKLDTGAYGTALYSPRIENVNRGIEMLAGSDRTGMFHPYIAVASTGVFIDAGINTTHYRFYGICANVDSTPTGTLSCN